MPINNKRFHLSALSAAVVAASVNLQAQETSNYGDAALEEITVTGIRQSLTNAMDIKRDSSGVVEAISAEDIGKFPDTNLAESLQRMTGVSIDRSNNEGNKVTVRGFGPNFNLVTLNGRQMPNSSALQSEGITRSFRFAEISAESVSGVEVYKTGKADVYSGGIGSTINIKTARPFDYDGLVASASVKGVMDTSVENGDSVTPEIASMVSSKFFDDKFGVLLAFSHAERDSRSEAVKTQGWVPNYGTADTSAIDRTKNPEGTYWAPWTFDVDVADHQRERQNGQLVLQFAPIDSVTATLDYTASRYDEEISMNRTSVWFDSSDGVTDANGTVINPSVQNDELNFWAWDYHFVTENDSIGFNVEWEATDSLCFALDVHDSTSQSQPNGEPAETIANTKNPGKLVDAVADFSSGSGLPGISFDDSALDGGAYDPDNIVSDLFQERGYQIENNIQQVQLTGTWDNLDDGALRTIKFGIANTDYQIDVYESQSFAFVDLGDLSEMGIDFESLGDFGSEIGNNSGLFPLLADYEASDFIDAVKASGQYYEATPTFDKVSEETFAAFVSMDFETEFNGYPIRVNAGLRFEDTEVTGTSIQNGFLGLSYWHSEELREVTDDTPSADTLEGEYTRFLPNLDASIELTDELVARASYSRTLSRADISAMFPSTSLNVSRPGGPFNASQGNPGLLPITSDNFDLSVEYYYDEGSYVSLGYFKKYVENFIGSTTEERVIYDVNGNPLTDPSVNPRSGCPDSSGTNPACMGTADDPVITWNVTTSDNLEDAEVYGWEFAVQHMFGDSGFGTIFNATLVDGDVDYDVYSTDNVFALTGLSDSANLIGFYEQGPLQVRLAYNWRDDFLLDTRQSQIGGEPVFTEAYGQWDLNASYDVTENVSVFFEGLNITEETIRRHGRFANQLVSAEQYGARYNFGVRAKF
ncbi:TonB-dependent receptor [Microbulbifer thermotolerans]|uniref:TonB-dependent receptor n=1 Tax=Microbulbifer thermotolerans TaxID=252514 RepID=UPI00267266C5|nr:TonB-dependent receptor [Microbulbifer thermotolerans]WKT59411.1 TonB-dependent receptor [Microbulbifer thermotolerans]